MSKGETLKLRLKDQHGVTVILVAIMIVVFIGFTALAVDISHLYVVRNELQNAADAGALAGARVLYTEDGTAIDPNANEVAKNAAIANKSEKASVEVNWTGGNGGDVQRGHWRFATKTFTPNDSLLPVNLWDVSFEDLDKMDGSDGNLPFINAVRVKTRRETKKADSFFAKIWGYTGFNVNTEAIAYIGFAGETAPIDQPIAICYESIIDYGSKPMCNAGRMINSGEGGNYNTGGWTNFTFPCETATTPTVLPLICSTGGILVEMSGEIGTAPGMEDKVFDKLRNCWIDSDTTHPTPDPNNGLPDEPWTIKLLVIECPKNNIDKCSKVRGVIEVNVLWITESGEDNQYINIPRKMTAPDPNNPGSNIEYTCPKPPGSGKGKKDETKEDRINCWNNFVTIFGLEEIDSNGIYSDANYSKKSIYLLPDCTPSSPSGQTGGYNFGVLARIPKLVN